MNYEHAYWESKIRDAAKQSGDDEILALSSAEIQDVIKEIEKDYPSIRKPSLNSNKKHLNIYSKAAVCVMLCKAIKDLLETYSSALQDDLIKQYIFSFSKACDITYDTDFDRFYNAIFTVYNNEDVLIEIDTYHMEVLGYIAYHLVTTEDLEQSTAKILYEAAQKVWNEIKSTKDIGVFASTNEDLMTVDILPLLST